MAHDRWNALYIRVTITGCVELLNIYIIVTNDDEIIVTCIIHTPYQEGNTLSPKYTRVY